jgi:LmbE family N-acetylglucosaminyl deacetylase
VLSPHLDDAVYSAHTALAASGPRRKEVVTVVTSAPVGVKTYWSARTGFADSHVEHIERCAEDVRALESMGVGYRHLGADTENMQSLGIAISQMLLPFVHEMEDWAFLLPAGAGRHIGYAEKIWRRFRRRPEGRIPHPEHVRARNLVQAMLRKHTNALWGFYAEIPYVLFDSIEILQQRIEKFAGRSLNRVDCQPDANAKLMSAQAYASQAQVALGREPAEQLQFANLPEHLFLS